MKIFGISKKEYQKKLLELQDEKKELLFTNEKHKTENGKLREELKNQEKLVTKKANKINELVKKLEDDKEIISNLNEDIIQYKNTIRKINGAKGGLIKQINKLQDQLTEAQIKLSQRYIIKELKPQKARNTQVMKTKSGAKTSEIIKKVKEENDDD